MLALDVDRRLRVGGVVGVLAHECFVNYKYAGYGLSCYDYCRRKQ